MAALGVGFARGLGFEQMRAPLCAYQPLPHRCEIVRTVDGVEWVNDSKGTNLDAVEKALALRDAARGADRRRQGQGISNTIR